MRETSAAADAPPDPEPATGVHEKPARVRGICGHCDLAPRFRRGLCRSCYRKLSEAGCPLPPARPTRVPDPTPALERWVRTLSDETRRQIAALLMGEP